MKRVIPLSVALVVSVAAALVGQRLLPQIESVQLGAVYAGVAVAAFLWALHVSTRHALPAAHRLAPPREPQPDGWIPLIRATPAQRLALLSAAAVMAVYAFRHLGGNVFSVEGTIAWLAALLTFLGAVWQVPADAPARLRAWWATRPFLPATWAPRLRRRHLLLLLFFAVAAFYRFFRLDALPLDMTSDHAEKLFDVYDVLSGQRPIFFPRNTGREAFQFYLTAAIIRLTGLPVGYLPLKIGTALTGLLTLPAVYLLAKTLYGRGVGLITTAFFAISTWHVAISRVGLRFPFTAAFATPTLYFVFRAFQYGRRRDWLLAGLWLGVGLHTYIPMRMVPLLLIILALLKLAFDALQRRRPAAAHPDAWTETSALQGRFWLDAALGGLTSLLVFLPLLRYMADEPHMFWLRVTTRSLDGGTRLPAESWRVFWSNVKNALLAFNVRGDPVVTNSLPFTPFLEWVSGAFFMLGMAYLLWRLVKYRDRRTVYVLAALFVMLLPSILSLEFPQENPSRVRAGGAIPLAMLIAALPVWVMWQQARALWQQARAPWPRVGRWVVVGVTAVFCLVALRDSYVYYFVDYDFHIRRSLWNTREIGAVVRGFAASIGDMDHVYHVSYSHWADTRLIGINAGATPWQNAIQDVAATDTEQMNDADPKLFILHPLDNANLQALLRRYPRGWVHPYHSDSPGDKDFYAFYVPPG